MSGVTLGSLETPEGHTVQYDEQGAVIGLELLHARLTLEHEGALGSHVATGGAIRAGAGPGSGAGVKRN